VPSVAMKKERKNPKRKRERSERKKEKDKKRARDEREFRATFSLINKRDTTDESRKNVKIR
jgi:hypothetical protein